MALVGTDTTDSCAVGVAGREVVFNGHLAPDSTDYRKPDQCWERPDGAQFDLEYVFAFTDGDHPNKDYYLLDLYGQNHYCPEDPDSLQAGAQFIERLQTIYHGHDGGPKDSILQEGIVIPSGYECALLALKPSADTAHQFRQNYDISVRVFTKMGDPTSLTAVLGGDSIHVSWENAESSPTLLLRRQIDDAQWDTLTTLPSGDSDYADRGWDYDTTYIYKVRHRAPEVIGTIRMSEYSNADTLLVPDTLIASVTGPTAVRKLQECTWVGSATGGDTPYSYGWSGLASGSGSMLVTSFTHGGNLYLTVTDESGWIAKDTILIAIDPDAGECEMR